LKKTVSGALDASGKVPELNTKVDLHETRIENLEQKSTVFEAALKQKEKSLG
jgi:hypothetical protein